MVQSESMNSMDQTVQNSSTSSPISHTSPLETIQVQIKDPYSLLNAQKSSTELENIRKTGTKGKALYRFYKQQNRLITSLLSDPMDRDEDEEAKLFKVKIAIYGSAAVNLSLVVLQCNLFLIFKTL